MGPMLDVEVIEDPAAAAVALDPIRSRLLAELAEPGSAATLAARVGIPRQKVNYHLRALEAHGLVELAEERKRGGITERVMRATASSYVVSPAALGETAVDPDQADRLSARHLIALAGRLVREVGGLSRGAQAAGKRLPTFSIDTEIRFRSAEDRAAFADDLTAAVLDLAARYHHDDGRPHRLVVAAHPTPKETLMTTPDKPLRFEFEVEVAGTPEQVWDAIATGAGISSWFLPTDLEPRRGRGDRHAHGRHLVAGLGHRLGPAPPLRVRGARVGRARRAPGRGRDPADHRVPGRGPIGRHLRRACHQQRLRHRRRLGERVLRRYGVVLAAVLRPPAPVPRALPRPAGHPARGAGRPRRRLGAGRRRARSRPQPGRRRARRGSRRVGRPRAVRHRHPGRARRT